MNRLDALDAAKRAVADRPNQYGAPEQNFERIAALWNAHLANSNPTNCCDLILDASEVAIMLALVKIARLEADPSHADSWIDLAGYAACGAEVSGATAPVRCVVPGGCSDIGGPCPSCQPDKPAQNSDLVDDVIREQANAVWRAMNKPESKFGFTVGETVNLISSPEGMNPGVVVGFNDHFVRIRYPHDDIEWGPVRPASLRHGP